MYVTVSAANMMLSNVTYNGHPVPFEQAPPRREEEDVD